MQHWLRQQGHADQVANSAAEQVCHLLMTTLNSEDGQWVLKTPGDAELAIMALLSDKVKSYIVDRTFIVDNVRWIIDYKTTPLAIDASQEVLKSSAETYRAQLESYAALYVNQGIQVKCAVLFMHIGKLVSIA